jgi:DNA-binding NarL/FixJ family response regulator
MGRDKVRVPGILPSATTLEVLQRLSYGQHPQMIARVMHMGESTVRHNTHTARIQLEASTTIEAVSIAIRRGLI